MKIPDKVVNRLTLYHFILDDLKENEQYISSSKIAELLNIDDSQVRKDLKYISNLGKCRVGYEVKALKRAIEDKLGFKKTKDVFVVGAGNLGSALVKYGTFQDYGLNILAMFDNDKNKIGTSVNGKKIFDVAKISELSQKLNVDIAILTVPKDNAKAV